MSWSSAQPACVKLGDGSAMYQECNDHTVCFHHSYLPEPQVMCVCMQAYASYDRRELGPKRKQNSTRQQHCDGYNYCSSTSPSSSTCSNTFSHCCWHPTASVYAASVLLLPARRCSNQNWFPSVKLTAKDRPAALLFAVCCNFPVPGRPAIFKWSMEWRPWNANQ